MPIKPIDLQTLFTQMDKVGREKAAERDTSAMQVSLQAAQSQKKAAEQNTSVQGTRDDTEVSKKGINIDEKEEQGAASADEGDRGGPPDDGNEPEKPEAEVIRDPGLGTKIDISG
jgi:hypothetical protein